jgi:radial spoke head protein 9
LELALSKLQNDQNYDEILFWGKISGTVKDYFIALALTFQVNNTFPTKKFFWASSGNYIFSELPQFDSAHTDSLRRLEDLFTGEFDTVLIEGVGEAKVIPA